MTNTVNQTLMMCLLGLSFCLLCPPSSAQNLATDLAISISSPQFAAGVLSGEPATVTIQITNRGPTAVDFRTDALDIFPGELLGQNESHYFEFLNQQIIQGDCQLMFNEGSPLPPVNNVYYHHYYQVRVAMAVGATYRCDLQVTLNQLSMWQTTWRLGGAGYTDLDPSNNTTNFTFRGQPMPVPLPHSWLLLIGLLVLAAWHLKSRSGIR